MVSWVTFFIGVTVGMILLAAIMTPDGTGDTGGERATPDAPTLTIETPDWMPTLDALKYLFSAMIITVSAVYWLLV